MMANDPSDDISGTNTKSSTRSRDCTVNTTQAAGKLHENGIFSTMGTDKFPNDNHVDTRPLRDITETSASPNSDDFPTPSAPATTNDGTGHAQSSLPLAAPSLAHPPPLDLTPVEDLTALDVPRLLAMLERERQASSRVWRRGNDLEWLLDYQTKELVKEWSKVDELERIRLDLKKQLLEALKLFEKEKMELEKERKVCDLLRFRQDNLEKALGAERNVGVKRLERERMVSTKLRLAQAELERRLVEAQKELENERKLWIKRPAKDCLTVTSLKNGERKVLDNEKPTWESC